MEKHEEKEIRTKTFRTIFTYRILFIIARDACRDAKEIEEGSFYNSIIAIVFSAFVLEAYLNHLGQKLILEWDTQERKLGPLKKLLTISKHISLELDLDQQPFRSFQEIFNFRNELVHGKTEYLKEEVYETLLDSTIFDKPKLPKSTWEEKAKPSVAEKFFKDTETMIAILQEKSGIEDPPLFAPWVGGWERRYSGKK